MRRYFLLAATVTFAALPAQAQSALGCATISFETVPGAEAADFLVIDTQFEASLGLTFTLENGSSPQLAAPGEPTSAFEPNDSPKPDQGIGDFFLTDDGILTSTQEPSPLIVTFAAPADSASGVVLDIDGGETFTIQARDATGAVLDETVITAGDEGTGDGRATPWGFRRDTPDVASIRFVGVRPSGRFGLGFDNFTTCVPARVPPLSACVSLDFESIPGAVPFEGLEIGTQFEASLALTFTLEDGTLPHLAAPGEPTTAFEPNDRPDADQNTGDFYLTDDGVLISNSAPSPLIVTFGIPADSASGVVLDIDGGETFTIQARDATGAVLDETVITAGDEGTGDGRATPWGFRRDTPDVASIRFVGFRPSGRFGLGFDNFTTCAPGRVTSIEDPAGPDEAASLLPARPNPFRSRTTLRYTLLTAGPVRLSVYDVLGREVATLVDRTEAAGDHAVVFDAGTLSDGAYWVRLDAGGQTGAIPVTVVR